VAQIRLSIQGHDLLRVLVQHAGKVLTHRFLLKEMWDETTDAQYLRVCARQSARRSRPIPSVRNSC